MSKTSNEKDSKPQDGIQEVSGFTGETLLRRDPATLRPTAADDTPPELVAKKHKPIHVFTEYELKAIEDGSKTREQILAETEAAPAPVVEEPLKPSLSLINSAPVQLETKPAESIGEVSASFVDWAIEFIDRAYPGIQPAIMLPDGGQGRPLLFFPIARAGKFGAVFDVREIPADMDPGTAARTRTEFSNDLRRYMALGYWCAVANGEAHARDLFMSYMQYDETARY